ncbi:MAG: hypothetical protein AAB426_02110, partial [Myxococcota bacterium]
AAAGTLTSCAGHATDVPFAGGTGTLEDPFLICSVVQLGALAADTNYWSHWYAFRLMGDLDLTGFDTSAFPIGNATEPFVGFVDGNGQTISGFALTSGVANGVGLFGNFAGVVRRLGVVDVNVQGSGTFVGGLIGQTFRPGLYTPGFVVDVYTSGSVTGASGVAGLIGLSDIAVANCYTTATVDSGYSGAGLINESTAITVDSFASNDVVAANGGGRAMSISGLAPVGMFFDSSKTCSNCTATLGTAASPTSYFFDPANAPLASWDFTNVWQSHAPSGFPTLR